MGRESQYRRPPGKLSRQTVSPSALRKNSAKLSMADVSLFRVSAHARDVVRSLRWRRRYVISSPPFFPHSTSLFPMPPSFLPPYSLRTNRLSTRLSRSIIELTSVEDLKLAILANPRRLAFCVDLGPHNELRIETTHE